MPIPKCYLCGKDLAGKKSMDHVPPLKFFPADLRRKFNPNLLTIPTHESCNTKFQKDEDYFIATLVPLIQDSVVGSSLYKHWIEAYKKGNQIPLYKMVLREFETRPSGLFLPPGRVVKRINRERVDRIAWKIVRGLFYHEKSRIIPEWTPHTSKVIPPGERPPSEFSMVRNQPENGQYKRVFAYKYLKIEQVHNMNYWALLLWDAMILTVAFHDIDCDCNTCIERRIINNFY